MVLNALGMSKNPVLSGMVGALAFFTKGHLHKLTICIRVRQLIRANVHTIASWYTDEKVELALVTKAKVVVTKRSMNRCLSIT